MMAPTAVAIFVISIFAQALSAPNRCATCQIGSNGWVNRDNLSQRSSNLEDLTQQAETELIRSPNQLAFDDRRPGNWTDVNRYRTDDGHGNVYEEHGQRVDGSRRIRFYKKNFTSSYSTGNLGGFRESDSGGFDSSSGQDASRSINHGTIDQTQNSAYDQSAIRRNSYDSQNSLHSTERVYGRNEASTYHQNRDSSGRIVENNLSHNGQSVQQGSTAWDQTRPGNWSTVNSYRTDGGNGRVYEERGQYMSGPRQVRFYKKNYTSSSTVGGVIPNNNLGTDGSTTFEREVQELQRHFDSMGTEIHQSNQGPTNGGYTQHTYEHGTQPSGYGSQSENTFGTNPQQTYQHTTGFENHHVSQSGGSSVGGWGQDNTRDQNIEYSTGNHGNSNGFDTQRGQRISVESSGRPRPPYSGSQTLQSYYDSLSHSQQADFRRIYGTQGLDQSRLTTSNSNGFDTQRTQQISVESSGRPRPTYSGSQTLQSYYDSLSQSQQASYRRTYGTQGLDQSRITTDNGNGYDIQRPEGEWSGQNPERITLPHSGSQTLQSYYDSLSRSQQTEYRRIHGTQGLDQSRLSYGTGSPSGQMQHYEQFQTSSSSSSSSHRPVANAGSHQFGSNHESHQFGSNHESQQTHTPHNNFGNNYDGTYGVQNGKLVTQGIDLGQIAQGVDCAEGTNGHSSYDQSNYHRIYRRVAKPGGHRRPVEDLTQQTEDLTQQSEDLTQQTEDLTQQTEDLTQQTQDLTQQTEDLTQQSQHFGQESWRPGKLEVESERVHDLHQQTEDLTQQTEDLTQQTEDLTQQAQDLTQQTEDLTQQNQHFGQESWRPGKLEVESQRVHDLHQQTEDLTQQTEDLTQQTEDLTQQTQDLTQQTEDLTQQNQHFGQESWRPGKLEVESQRVHDLHQQTEDLTQQTEHLTQQTEDLTQQTQDLTQQTEDLTQQSQHFGQESWRPGKLEVESQQIHDLTQQTEDLTQQTEDLTQQTEDLTQQTQDLTQQTEDLAQQDQTSGPESWRPGKLEVESQRVHDLTQQTEDLTQQTEHFGQQTEDLTQQSQHFGQESWTPGKLEVESQRVHDLTQQTEDLTQQTEDLAQQTAHLGQQTEDLTQQTEHLGQQTEDLNQQSQHFGQESWRPGKLEVESQRVHDLTQQTEDLTQQTEHLGQQTEDLTQQTEHLGQQTEDLTQQSQHFGQESWTPGKLEVESQRVHDLTQQTEDLGQQTEDLTQQTEHLGQQTEDLTQQSQHFGQESWTPGKLEVESQRVHDLTQQTEDLTQQTEHLGQQTEDLTQQTEHRGQQTEDLTQQSQHFGQESWTPGKLEVESQRVHDLTQQTEDLTQQTEHLGQQTEDLTQQTEHLGQQTEDLTQQSQHFGQESWTPGKLEVESQRVHDLTQQTEDLTQQTEHLGQQTEDLTQQTENLGQQTEDLTQQSQHFGQQPWAPGKLEIEGQQVQDLTQQSENLGQETEDFSQNTGNTDHHTGQITESAGFGHESSWNSHKLETASHQTEVFHQENHFGLEHTVINHEQVTKPAPKPGSRPRRPRPGDYNPSQQTNIQLEETTVLNSDSYTTGHRHLPNNGEWKPTRPIVSSAANRGDQGIGENSNESEETDIQIGSVTPRIPHQETEHVSRYPDTEDTFNHQTTSENQIRPVQPTKTKTSHRKGYRPRPQTNQYQPSQGWHSPSEAPTRYVDGSQQIESIQRSQRIQTVGAGIESRQQQALASESGVSTPDAIGPRMLEAYGGSYQPNRGSNVYVTAKPNPSAVLTTDGEDVWDVRVVDHRVTTTTTTEAPTSPPTTPAPTTTTTEAPTTTTPAPSFWKRVGSSITNTYDKAKEKAKELFG